MPSMRDRRGVSTTLAYVLSFGISALLISGLVIGAGTFIDGERDRTAEAELQVIGEQIVSDLHAADRLVRAGETDTVTIRRELPSRVVGDTYTVEVVAGGDELELATSHTSVRVTFDTQTDIDTAASAGGGTIVIEYDSGADELEVTNG
ncbi:DUF7266 family protein [Natronomonas sp.]|uniref:DUF7266 family protein n=1 Tax=Natronomonas sp. TaxID=2184060 RepID=UPI002FC3AED4